MNVRPDGPVTTLGPLHSAAGGGGAGLSDDGLVRHWPQCPRRASARGWRASTVSRKV